MFRGVDVSRVGAGECGGQVGWGPRGGQDNVNKADKKQDTGGKGKVKEFDRDKDHN